MFGWLRSVVTCDDFEFILLQKRCVNWKTARASSGDIPLMTTLRQSMTRKTAAYVLGEKEEDQSD